MTTRDVTTRVLVLGADGFIGQHLTRALAASDWALPIGAGRRPATADSTSQIARLQLDATDEHALDNALQDAQAVVSCISGGAQTIADSARALFAAAARQHRPPLVVYLSSMAVYGALTGVVSESAPLLGEDPYARAKIAAENAGARYDRVVILRPGIVYGPGSSQWTERIGRWLFARRVGDLGALGDGCCNLVHVQDVVTAILQSLRLTAEGQARTYNLVMAGAPTWNEYFVRFARALGAVPVARIGRRQLRIETKLLAPPLKIAQLALRKARLAAIGLPEPIPPSVLRLCQQDIRLDGSSAEQSLQLNWIALEDGLRQAADWFNRRLNGRLGRSKQRVR
jgi:nucleoside-diphosphate-sugar epimerase